MAHRHQPRLALAALPHSHSDQTRKHGAATTRAWALARYTPHPIAALEAAMELGDFWKQS